MNSGGKWLHQRPNFCHDVCTYLQFLHEDLSMAYFLDLVCSHSPCSLPMWYALVPTIYPSISPILRHDDEQHHRFHPHGYETLESRDRIARDAIYQQHESRDDAARTVSLENIEWLSVLQTHQMLLP